jgi:hypothetical protein
MSTHFLIALLARPSGHELSSVCFVFIPVPPLLLYFPTPRYLLAESEGLGSAPRAAAAVGQG